MKIKNTPYTSFAQKLFNVLQKNNVEYMVIGGIGAVLQGFDYSTQDIDIYLQKDKSNIDKFLKSLNQIHFSLSDKNKNDIMQGKDFIQIDDPFELDIVFAPDGFEDYNEAKKYKIFVENIPVMSLEGIIKSKKAANRPKDRLMLPSLIDFLKFKRAKRESYDNIEDLFFVPSIYEITDIQTIRRWIKNEKRTIQEKLIRGLLTI